MFYEREAKADEAHIEEKFALQCAMNNLKGQQVIKTYFPAGVSH